MRVADPASGRIVTRPGYTGIYFDDFLPDTAWLRDTGVVHLPPLAGPVRLKVRGEWHEHPDAVGPERVLPGLRCYVGRRFAQRIEPMLSGPWSLSLELSAAEAEAGADLHFVLRGVTIANALAWLGRVTRLPFLQRYRQQRKNRQLRLARIEHSDGTVLFDFGQRAAPFRGTHVLPPHRLGLNVVGFHTADLGVGESARCMVRAAAAAGLPVAAVPLRLACKNPLGDRSLADRLQADNPHPVNVFHLDPPVTKDIDYHHGRTFRQGRYNIGYWAWELPDFPPAWVPQTQYLDEIWCPSDFTRDAVAWSVPVPVLTLPHAVAFPRPTAPRDALRAQFQLPTDRFLFLFVYDLNSYSARKNPQAVLAAYRASGLADRGAGLVIKVHNVAGNEKDFAALAAAVADLPGTTLIRETLPRADVYALEAACDCFVSLHRAEGFGFGVAECMYLGKPVIATDWSATAEYLRPENGAPVRCTEVELAEHCGPYFKGSRWAEPDVEHAAWWMRQLHADSALAARLGAAARVTIETRFSPAAIGARYRRRLEAIALFA